MRLSAEKIKERLQEAAGKDAPVVAWGLGYLGPSTYAVGATALGVWLLGVAIGIFTFKSWAWVAGATLAAVLVYLFLRARVKFTLVGVSPKHFIAIDVTPRGQFLPPARQGLSAIQFPRLIEKELSTILHYVLGDGSIHDVRFQDFGWLPDNRRAAHRIKGAVLENVYRSPGETVGASREPE
ncbi:MAG: hypothetical protein HY656_03630 [Acidobacteria bacterium]|nr:hypothetical protein [Acidobacteriota bacterium]